MSSSPTPAPSPEHIFQTLIAFQQAAALKAGLDLNVFTAIGEGARSAAAIAARVQASERGIRILCDYLAIKGLLTKKDGEYGLTPESALFLDHRSPAYLGGIRHFLQCRDLVEACNGLTEAVRTGSTQLAGQGCVTPENPAWVEFARSMTAMMGPASQGIAQMLAAAPPRRVLDIAAGHGLFGIAIAQRCPEAEVTALDWPAVLAIAQENAQRAGVEARYKLLPGDAFEVDYGTGYDVVLATNFFHHFDQPTCERLMRKIHAALRPGGRCVTLEFVPNEDRVSPPMPAAFSLMMLATTPAGDAYTYAEYERMFGAAGFARNERHNLPMSPETVIVSTRD